MSCKRKRKRYSDRLIEINRSPIKSSLTAKFMFSWGENIGAIFSSCNSFLLTLAIHSQRNFIVYSRVDFKQNFIVTSILSFF